MFSKSEMLSIDSTNYLKDYNLKKKHRIIYFYRKMPYAFSFSRVARKNLQK